MQTPLQRSGCCCAGAARTGCMRGAAGSRRAWQPGSPPSHGAWTCTLRTTWAGARCGPSSRSPPATTLQTRVGRALLSGMIHACVGVILFMRSMLTTGCSCCAVHCFPKTMLSCSKGEARRPSWVSMQVMGFARSAWREREGRSAWHSIQRLVCCMVRGRQTLDSSNGIVAAQCRCRSGRWPSTTWWRPCSRWASARSARRSTTGRAAPATGWCSSTASRSAGSPGFRVLGFGCMHPSGCFGCTHPSALPQGGACTLHACQTASAKRGMLEFP